MPRLQSPPDRTARETRAPPGNPHLPARADERLSLAASRARKEPLSDEARILQFLDATSATLARTHDVALLLQAVIDAATHAAGAAFGAIFYCDSPVPAERPEAALPGPACPLIALSGVHDAGDGVFDSMRTARAFANAWHANANANAIVRCGDVTRPPRPPGQAALHPGLDVDGEPALRSFLAVPISLPSGEVTGGLFFGHPEADVFDECTQRIVEGVAAHAAVALENARLMDGLRRSTAEHERLAAAARGARAESARAARIKDEFLATLSHELRTPLTAILGWAQVLLQRDDAAMRTRGLQAIARNASAQAHLIEDLLDMSRIVSGKVELDMRPVDLSEVVQRAVDSLQAAASAKAVTLAYQVAPEAACVRGDALRLCQIVWNLASNAIEFTPRQGRVDVSVERVGGEIEIAVVDTGVGIEPAFLPHVFDHFRQADGSTTRRHGGLGMGLAIVRTLAALHGGTATAASEGAGCGARFVVRLPAPSHAPDGARANVPNDREGRQDRGAEEQAHRLRGDVAPSEAHPFRGEDGARETPPFTDIDLAGLDLLVVDDETDARELVAQVLAECGATVRQASGAAEAMREFVARPPDVLVSDIGMPERDGYELMREIRRLAPAEGCAVPALALTAFVQSEDRDRARDAGFQTHLAKPVQPDALVAAVATLAGRPVASGHA